MRSIFTMLDDLTATLQELKTALAPFQTPTGTGSRTAQRGRKPSGATQPSPASTQRPTARKSKRTGSRAKKASGGPAKRAASPAQIKHGRYIGLLRTLGKADQKAMKKLRMEKNVDAAIAFAAAKKRA